MNIEQLKNRDYVLVIDRSGSMTGVDTHNGKSRWSNAQESTLALAQKLNEYDPDGITVYAFNDKFKKWPNTTPSTVDGIWREVEPGGGTTLAPVLRDIFNDYLARKAKGQTKANGEIALVVTDGEPSDRDEVAKEIVKFTKSLDNGDGEYGISFIQVGRDAGAASFLKKLDDDLVSQGAKFDIVDTKTMEDMNDMPLVDVLVAALTD